MSYFELNASPLNDALMALTPIALHPYFKLAYIEVAWGGPAEQEQEREAGNPLAKDWQDEARKILEHIVRVCSFNVLGGLCTYLTRFDVTDRALLQEPANYNPHTSSTCPC
jgi:hypothetical protein